MKTIFILILISQSPLAANKVERVIDVDTLVLNRSGHQITCRLIGANGPETKHPTKPVEFYGPEATAYLKTWIEGKVIRVDYEVPGKRDRYNRLLIYGFADNGKQNINVELVRRGLAKFDSEYKTRYRAEFIEAQKKAKAEKLGLWAQPEPDQDVENFKKHFKLTLNYLSKILSKVFSTAK